MLTGESFIRVQVGVSEILITHRRTFEWIDITELRPIGQEQPGHQSIINRIPFPDYSLLREASFKKARHFFFLAFCSPSGKLVETSSNRSSCRESFCEEPLSARACNVFCQDLKNPRAMRSQCTRGECGPGTKLEASILLCAIQGVFPCPLQGLTQCLT
jgi:hypothetical protein